MKKNRTIITVFLIITTFGLLGAIFYISNLLSSPSSPTQVKKTKAAAVTYSRKVDLFPTIATDEPIAPINPTITIIPIVTPVVTKAPTSVPTKTPTIIPTITKAPTSVPTIVPTLLAQTSGVTPTLIPTSTVVPTRVTEPTVLPATPTSESLLAYNSTTLSPTTTSTKNTNSISPTKKAQPTGIKQLPETGWIHTSSILFIVAASTILFSLLF